MTKHERNPDPLENASQPDIDQLQRAFSQGEKTLNRHLLKWLPPGVSGESHASWLELFYDLIFVVAVSQLTHVLSGDLTIEGLSKYLFLFLPVFSGWVATNNYNDRFVVEDQIHRLLIFSQMIAVAFMAASISGAMEDRSAEFAVSVGSVRLLLVLMYLRVIVSDENRRQLATRICAIYSVTAFVWIASAFVAEPINYYLWGITLIIDVGAFLLPSTRRYIGEVPRSLAHRQERFGLFVIIVMGESATGVVDGLLDHTDWTRSIIVTVIFGMTIVFALWRIYFGLEDKDPEIIKKDSFRAGFWIFAHYPLVVAIAAYGVAIELAIAEPQGESFDGSDRWLFAGAIAVTLMAIFLVRGLQTDIVRAVKTGWGTALSAAILLLMAALFQEASVEIFVVVSALVVTIIPILAFRSTVKDSHSNG